MPQGYVSNVCYTEENGRLNYHWFLVLFSSGKLKILQLQDSTTKIFKSRSYLLDRGGHDVHEL